ncbi:MAG: META domain-containing protein [Chloroflexota bacterium]
MPEATPEARDPEAALVGVTWHLTRGVARRHGLVISARFAGGTVAGSAGVNRYRAEYDLAGGRLRLGPTATTKMGGDPDRLAAERDFLTLLGAVDGLTVDASERRLTLLDAAGDPILWFDAVPEVARELTGRWSVAHVRRDGELVAPSERAAAHLVVDAAGSVTGFTGADRLRGRARTDGDRLYLGPIIPTRIGASSEVMDEGAAFLAALEQVAAFHLDGEVLTLLDADGETVLDLRWA